MRLLRVRGREDSATLLPRRVIFRRRAGPRERTQAPCRARGPCGPWQRGGLGVRTETGVRPARGQCGEKDATWSFFCRAQQDPLPGSGRLTSWGGMRPALAQWPLSAARHPRCHGTGSAAGGGKPPNPKAAQAAGHPHRAGRPLGKAA